MPNWVHNTISIDTTDLSKKQVDLLNKLKKNLENEEVRSPLCDIFLPIPEELRNTTSPTPTTTEEVTDAKLLETLKNMKENGEFGMGYIVNGESYSLHRVGEHKGKYCHNKLPSCEEAERLNKEQEGKKFRTWYISKKRQQELINKYGYDNWYSWSANIIGTKWGDCDTEVDVFRYGKNKSIEETTITFNTAWSPLGERMVEYIVDVFPNLRYTYEEEQGWGADIHFEDGEVVLFEEWDIPDFTYVTDDKEHLDSLTEVQKNIIVDSEKEIFYVKEKCGNPDAPYVEGYYIEWPEREGEGVMTIDELCTELAREASRLNALNVKALEEKDSIQITLDSLKPENFKGRWEMTKKASDLLGELSESKLVKEYISSFDYKEFKK